MLIELALRGRLQLEACGMRRKSLLTRKVRGVLNKYILIKEFVLPKMKFFSNRFQKLKEVDFKVKSLLSHDSVSFFHSWFPGSLCIMSNVIHCYDHWSLHLTYSERLHTLFPASESHSLESLDITFIVFL